MSYLKIHTLLWAIITIALLPKIALSLVIKNSDYINDRNYQNMKEYSPPTAGINYDDYPMVVPKRAAMLLDRIMVALHHALEDDEKGAKKINDVYRDGRYYTGKKIKEIKTEKNRGKFISSTESGDSFDDTADLEIRDLSGQYGRQDDTMGLQRRGHDDVGTGKGRVYWRCYFNAVTCF